MDIGLYYIERAPFQIGEIRRIAGRISTHGSPTVTGFYEWGPWVNGGAWILTKAGKVDFLYRNLDQVQRTIEQAQQGIVHHDYDQQPAFGFYSVAYLAETRINIPLFDPKGVITQLKGLVQTYPPRLKDRLVAGSLWSAEFTFLHARGFAKAGDGYNTVGCLARAAAYLTQALFALNERYFLSDKRAMEEMSSFPILPPAYLQRLSEILACPGADARTLGDSVARLQRLWEELVALAGGTYHPQFDPPDPSKNNT